VAEDKTRMAGLLKRGRGRWRTRTDHPRRPGSRSSAAAQCRPAAGRRPRDRAAGPSPRRGWNAGHRESRPGCRA